MQLQDDAAKLRKWAQRREGLHEVPTFNEALAGKHIHHISRSDTPDPIDRNAVAAENIWAIRTLVYLEPRLHKGHGERTVTDSAHADGEVKRRNVERGLYQDISRYYPLSQNQSAWARPSLLSLGKHERDHST